MNERRRKLVPVSSIFIMQQNWSTGNIVHAKCTEGLPSDATFIGLTYDHMRDAYYFCYQSAEWDEVPENEILPVITPRFTNLYIAPFLEQAERLIETQYDAQSTRWIEEYRAFKKQTGWPDDH